jgi:DNA-3-methyladenine glycosylase II
LTRETLERAARWLARRDGGLALIHERHGTPPLWGRRPGFPALVRIILEQQVSLASARAVFARLAERADPLTARRVVALGQGRLRRLGLTRQKSGYCMHLARWIARGRLDLRAVSRMSDAEARAELMRVKGIGSWTADIYLLMALRRPDVWPSGDLALAQSLTMLRGMRARPAPRRLEALAERWRPFRSVAARMLWQHYLAERNGGKR